MKNSTEVIVAISELLENGNFSSAKEMEISALIKKIVN
jgi:hypothetical protein